MGTRSLIHFKNQENQTICTVYQQYDGYLDYVGRRLAEFLQTGELTNGIPVGENKLFFNGMGCLAAQYISKNKTEAGNVYIYPPNTEDVGEEFTYTVSISEEGDLNMSCLELQKDKKFTPKEFLENI